MFAKFIVFPFHTVITALRNKCYLHCSHGVLTFINSFGVRASVVLKPIVTLVTPLTGATVTALADADETIYVTPAGTIAELALVLPSAANSRVGQVKRLVTSQIVSTLTVTVSGSGTVAPALAATTAGGGYRWECTSVAGTGIWLRTQ